MKQDVTETAFDIEKDKCRTFNSDCIPRIRLADIVDAKYSDITVVTDFYVLYFNKIIDIWCIECL